LGHFQKSYQQSLFCPQSLYPSAFPLFFARGRQPLCSQSFQRILRGAENSEKTASKTSQNKRKNSPKNGTKKTKQNKRING
jgi:hypothetical protein